MGNEQGVPQRDFGDIGPLPTPPGQNKAGQNVQDASPPKSKYSQEIFIVVRGLRRTGKTTLVSKMKGKQFDPDYIATPHLQAYDIDWKTPDNDLINVKLWDVVENALVPVETPEAQLPDATNVDTLKNVDGVVILIDTRFSDSIEIARDILEQLKHGVPVVIFSNFMDQNGTTPVIPDLLQNYIGKYNFIPGSLRTNQGLVELSKWLHYPLLYRKCKTYEQLLKAAQEDLVYMREEFIETANHYINYETAMNFAPKFIQTKPQPSQVMQPTQHQESNVPKIVPIKPTIFENPQDKIINEPIIAKPNYTNEKNFWGEEEDEEEEEPIIPAQQQPTTDFWKQFNSPGFGQANEPTRTKSKQNDKEEGDFWSDDDGDNNSNQQILQNDEDNEVVVPHKQQILPPKPKKAPKIIPAPQTQQKTNPVPIQSNNNQQFEEKRTVKVNESEERFWSDSDNNVSNEEINSKIVESDDENEPVVHKQAILKPKPAKKQLIKPANAQPQYDPHREEQRSRVVYESYGSQSGNEQRNQPNKTEDNGFWADSRNEVVTQSSSIPPVSSKPSYNNQRPEVLPPKKPRKQPIIVNQKLPQHQQQPVPSPIRQKKKSENSFWSDDDDYSMTASRATSTATQQRTDILPPRKNKQPIASRPQVLPAKGAKESQPQAQIPTFQFEEPAPPPTKKKVKKVKKIKKTDTTNTEEKPKRRVHRKPVKENSDAYAPSHGTDGDYDTI